MEPGRESLPESWSPNTQSTVPNTPSVINDEGDFGRLVPLNELARLAFSQVVETYLRDPDNYVQIRRYVQFEKDDDGFSDLSEPDNSQDARPGRLWKGYYRFNLAILPVSPALGWIAGSDCNGLGKERSFILTTNSKKYGVGRSHARFAFHPTTGCLLLHALSRTMTLHASFGVVKLMNNSRALTESATISMGNLTYSFEFTDEGETSRFHRSLENLMRTELGQTNFELSESLSTVGSQADIQLKDYTIKQAIASGTYGIVSPAYNKSTGEAVAIKRLQTRVLQSQRDKDRCEINVLRKLQGVDAQHQRIIRLVDTIEGDQVNGPIDEALIIYEPFLLTSLDKLTQSQRLDDYHRTEVCRQCIEGLAWIHGHGLMHRDIKPGNIGIKSFEPLGAVIFDFGHAIFAETSFDHMKGTIPYLAPEVLNLKCIGAEQRRYNKSTDVWAMGLTGYQLLYRVSWAGARFVVDEKGNMCRYRLLELVNVQQRLREVSRGPLSHVLRRIIVEDPDLRISAADALVVLNEAMGVWKYSDQPDNQKRPRSTPSQ